MNLDPRGEPALLINLAAAVLALLVTWKIGLTVEQAGYVVAAITAVAGAAAAAATRPIAPAAFTAAVTAGADLLAAFHYNLSPENVAALNGLLLAALALITRNQVSPVTGPGGPPNR